MEPPTPPPNEPGTIPTEQRARESRAWQRLRELAGDDGRLRFDRFVEVALYEPDAGFYTDAGASVGRSGSFYTAPNVTDLFGRALARGIAVEVDRMGRSTPVTIAEVGPGDGRLAADLLPELRRRLPSGALLSYSLIDRSPSLLAKAVERLAPIARESDVELHRAEHLADLGPIRGIVLANELLDSLPFRRFVRRGHGWQELGLRVGPGTLEWAEWAGSHLPPTLPEADEGTVIEVSTQAEAWLREVADHLVEGTAILVDYGDDEPALVRGRPRGTLAAVSDHRPVPDPLARPGRADVSAFVNFTRIREAARKAGLIERSYRSQADALLAWGFEELVREAVQAARGPEREVTLRLASKNLLYGFTNFRVLELSPNGIPNASPD